MSRQSVYALRQKDEDFAKDWDDALGVAVDDAEAEMWRRATKGTLKPIYHQGIKIDTVREFSDTLLIFALKAHKPDVYRETVRNEHSGPDGKPIEYKEIDEAGKRIMGKLAGLATRIGADATPSGNDTDGAGGA